MGELGKEYLRKFKKTSFLLNLLHSNHLHAISLINFSTHYTNHTKIDEKTCIQKLLKTLSKLNGSANGWLAHSIIQMLNKALNTNVSILYYNGYLFINRNLSEVTLELQIELQDFPGKFILKHIQNWETVNNYSNQYLDCLTCLPATNPIFYNNKQSTLVFDKTSIIQCKGFNPYLQNTPFFIETLSIFPEHEIEEICLPYDKQLQRRQETKPKKHLKQKIEPIYIRNENRNENIAKSQVYYFKTRETRIFHEVNRCEF